MRYRLTCLTPLLVGDGRKLSPIDYMVWKDHVNVLDQWRIFRLLSKGPRLEGYLTQLKTAEKLDFASWGGFAQNFAGRRIPFENAAYSNYWNRAAGESLHIPTFAAGASGPYLPATSIKGAMRTGMVFANWRDGMLQDTLTRVKGERLPRRPAEQVEEQALGQGGSNKMKLIGAGDSNPVATSQFKIYLLRTSTLQPKGSNFALGWKQTPRGAVDGARPEDSTPVFAEMAAPGATFEGAWDERTFLLQPEVRRSVRWPESFNRGKIFEAANIYAQGLLSLHRQYASWAGMGLLDRSLDELEQKLAAARAKGSCVLCLGWGGGLPAKSGWLDTTNADYRQILGAFGFYDRALTTNLPFPKTRRIVFLNNKPATLPGWAELEVV
ncbi:MAG TPA: type III-A CRISPR-associated RAMP protein Csm5 [Candidatus Sulfopaludibacter sp.]|nr:type III-A CRISPR-associated RAMP protein Csm5 [Candidatus Sulfopaludibacter sp.]